MDEKIVIALIEAQIKSIKLGMRFVPRGNDAMSYALQQRSKGELATLGALCSGFEAMQDNGRFQELINIIDELDRSLDKDREAAA